MYVFVDQVTYCMYVHVHVHDVTRVIIIYVTYIYVHVHVSCLATEILEARISKLKW